MKTFKIMALILISNNILLLITSKSRMNHISLVSITSEKKLTKDLTKLEIYFFDSVSSI